MHQRLLHVLQQIAHSRVRLLATGKNLSGRQYEAISSLVPQLNGEDIVGQHHIKNIVHGTTGSLVDSGADGAGGEGGSEEGLHGGCGAARERLQLCVLGWEDRAGVAVGYCGLDTPISTGREKRGTCGS